MDIAYVSTYMAKDVKNWSGLGYYISKALQDNGGDLHYVGELEKTFSVVNFLKKVYFTKMLNKKFALDRTVSISRGYADIVAKRLRDIKYDYVFSPGSIPIAYLKTSRPKIICSDATFACMLNYYEPSSELSSDSIRQGHEIEKQALDSCSLALYSSEWAAQSAITFYGTDPSKVNVVRFGANLDKEYEEAEVRKFISEKETKVLKIFFPGIDFIRKGGELVLEVLKKIKQKGIAVELHIVGVPVLPVDNVPEFVINHGFLHKSIPVERERLENLYKTCHFLFLPSKAEAYGVVFCEASSFGMPSISRKTGGIPSAITNGVSGFTLEASASVDDYVDLISYYFYNQDKYVQLSLSSYYEYKNRLNWNTAGKNMINLMKQL